MTDTASTSTGLLSQAEIEAVEALVSWGLSCFGVGGIVTPAVVLALQIGNRAASMGQTVPGVEELRAKIGAVVALPDLVEG